MAECLFELSGELGDMPRDEAAAVTMAECGGDCHFVSAGPGYVVFDVPDSAMRTISERLALSHYAGRYLGSFDPGDLARASGAALPEGTFAVRYRRFRGMMPEADSQDLVRRAGAALSVNNRVDLKHPDTTVRMLISDRVHLYLEDYRFEADPLQKRKASERPFFSPISLHPRYARALVNLTGVKRGDTVLDPFCGTGGIVIEAADMGMKAIASDFDPEMVAGTRENMAFYGLELEEYDTVDVGYVPERFPGVKAIACDLPYGRSTKTGGEPIDNIYERAIDAFTRTLAPGCRAGVVMPHIYDPGPMRLGALYEQRVHGSLSRFYHVYAR